MTLLLWLSDKHSWLYYSEGKRIICFAWWFLVHTSLEQGKCNTSLLKKKDYLFWTYLKKNNIVAFTNSKTFYTAKLLYKKVGGIQKFLSILFKIFIITKAKLFIFET